MKIIATIARVLLGLVFLVFGLNGFLHFMPMQPPPGLAGQYLGVMFVSHYLVAVFVLQLAGAIPLLLNRFVPLGLVILGPLIVNILLFHALMEPQGLPIALVVLVLWLIVFYSVRRAFAGIFSART
jgi:putative oxidoreductase